jgi:hypothetical protein
MPTRPCILAPGSVPVAVARADAIVGCRTHIQTSVLEMISMMW